MAAYIVEHAGTELLRETERLKYQVLTLQSKLLVSAKVVDSRLTFREGRQFFEYKLQIETNNPLHTNSWHRYKTFRIFGATLQTKNGFRRKDIPDLPNKQLFGSDRSIQERIGKLNQFLEAATNTDCLPWGVRVDQDNTDVGDSMVSTVASSSDMQSPRTSSRQSVSLRESIVGGRKS
ncbi:hypothetical protein H310_15326 [Aphanomyces invadans]|uniref:PX domain-containing protein n=1 Tax=Aphanomyces invadans TaxID=157072 RepID=A0A024T7H2_9STRA|nr:hypothetical protein H310_15326 [Aphanomyces invadans]ETV89835.1 hypothetical protein H310_15326 [Aphanomyces invadans]|eukprot:XP_008881533.1 hypothetical protein H310_15326 [Aphanomyces invadans]